MKEVKLTINGKEYSKAEPTIQDWFNNIDSQEAISKGLNTKVGITAYFKIVASYLDIQLSDLLKYGQLQPVTNAFKTINENLLECFGVSEETKNV